MQFTGHHPQVPKALLPVYICSAAMCYIDFPTCLQVLLHIKLAMTGAGQNFNLSVCYPFSVDCIR